MWKAWTLHMFWPQIVIFHFFFWYQRSIQPRQMKMSAWNHHHFFKKPDRNLLPPQTDGQASNPVSVVVGAWVFGEAWQMFLPTSATPGWNGTAGSTCLHGVSEPSDVGPGAWNLKEFLKLERQKCWEKTHMEKTSSYSVLHNSISVSISIWSMYQSMHLAISTMVTLLVIHFFSFSFFIFLLV